MSVCGRGYSSQDDFMGSENILVAVTVPVIGTARLTKFDCVTLTLIKLRINASNYDLGLVFFPFSTILWT